MADDHDGKAGRIRNSIAWHREKKRPKVTQVALAEKAGVERWILNRIERGRSLPTISQVEAIARALALTPADLYSDTALDLIRDAEQVA